MSPEAQVADSGDAKRGAHPCKLSTPPIVFPTLRGAVREAYARSAAHKCAPRQPWSPLLRLCKQGTAPTRGSRLTFGSWDWGGRRHGAAGAGAAGRGGCPNPAGLHAAALHGAGGLHSPPHQSSSLLDLLWDVWRWGLGGSEALGSKPEGQVSVSVEWWVQKVEELSKGGRLSLVFFASLNWSSHTHLGRVWSSWHWL